VKVMVMGLNPCYPFKINFYFTAGTKDHFNAFGKKFLKIQSKTIWDPKPCQATMQIHHFINHLGFSVMTT
jgi:hypothetical protein